MEEIKEGKSIAMVSDAGYPGVSDPGGILIKHAIENDVLVRVISGRSAGSNFGISFISSVTEPCLPRYAPFICCNSASFLAF